MKIKPYEQIGRIPRLVRRTAGTRPLAWLYSRIQEPLDQLVYRCTSGRATLTTWLGDVDMAMLTTTGAKSGLPRTHVVLGFADDDRIVVIASNYGQRTNPAWYYNLLADPRATIEIGGVSRSVVAHELDGPERERLYQRGIEIYPGFTHYRRRAQRTIPVLAFETA
jgi:deazaflavin-dependent oxidoreductase (nitroreductase family)